MLRPSLLVAVALVASSNLSSPAAAQGEKSLVITVDGGPTVLNPEVLVDGRLPPGELLRIRFSYVVEVPILTVCIVPITVLYAATADLVPAAVALSRNGQSQSLQNPQFGGLPVAAVSSVRMDGFTVDVSVVPGANAQAGQDLVLETSAKAQGGATTNGCNAKDAPFPATAAFIIRIA